MEGRVKVTVEFLDQPDVGTMVLEYPNCRIVQELGHLVTYNFDGLLSGKEPFIVPNGHQRACIQLWKGCRGYDDFQEKGLGCLESGCSKL